MERKKIVWIVWFDVVAVITVALLIKVFCIPNQRFFPLKNGDNLVELPMEELMKDSVTCYRTWKDPQVYLFDCPSDEQIAAWKKACEEMNSEYNEMKLPGIISGEFDSQVIFNDLVNVLMDNTFGKDFVLWRINDYHPSADPISSETLRYKFLCKQMKLAVQHGGNGSQCEINNMYWLAYCCDSIKVSLYHELICERFREIGRYLNNEFKAWKNYEKAIASSYDKVAMPPGYNGTAAPVAYYRFYSYVASLKLNGSIPFYLELTDPDNCPPRETHMVITEAMVQQAYDEFLAGLIYRDEESTYPLDVQRKVIIADRNAWGKWMKAREAVSAHLSADEKALYDNCTNNVRRGHLINLKNRYLWPDHKFDWLYDHLLNEDSSDEEILDYNFEKAIKD